MDRTRPLNRSAVGPTNRDLTVGLVGAIISLAITLYQNMTVGDQQSNALLMQSLVPIQQMLGNLMRKIQAVRPRSQAPPTRRHTYTAGTRPIAVPPTPIRAPARSVTPRPVNVTQPKMARTYRASSTVDSSRSNTSKPSFVVPPGWREISNLDEWIDESDIYPQMDSDAMDETPLMSEFEYSHDQDYYPSYNVEVAELDTSKSFRPTFQSTLQNIDESFSGTRPRSLTREQPALPKRVAELRRSEPGRRTFRQADGTYAIRETINTTNPDGSFQRITKTVSGPDVSIIQNLNETTELPSLNRTKPGSSAGGNVTFNVPPTAGPSKQKLDLYLLLCQSATALLVSLMSASERSSPAIQVAIKQKLFQLMETLGAFLGDHSHRPLQLGSSHHHRTDQTPLRASRSIRDMNASFRRPRFNGEGLNSSVYYGSQPSGNSHPTPSPNANNLSTPLRSNVQIRPRSNIFSPTPTANRIQSQSPRTPAAMGASNRQFPILRSLLKALAENADDGVYSRALSPFATAGNFTPQLLDEMTALRMLLDTSGGSGGSMDSTHDRSLIDRLEQMETSMNQLRQRVNQLNETS